MKSRRKFLTGVGAGAASLVLADSAHGFGRRHRGCCDTFCVEPVMACNARGSVQSFPCNLTVEGYAVYIQGERFNPGLHLIHVRHWQDQEDGRLVWACEVPWKPSLVVKAGAMSQAGSFSGHDLTIKSRLEKEMLKTQIYCVPRYGQTRSVQPLDVTLLGCCITCGDIRVCTSGTCVQCDGVCVPCP